MRRGSIITMALGAAGATAALVASPGTYEWLRRVTGRELQHDDGETQEREVVADVQPSNVTLSELLTRPRSAALGEGSKAEQAAAIMRAQLVVLRA